MRVRAGALLVALLVLACGACADGAEVIHARGTIPATAPPEERALPAVTTPVGTPTTTTPATTSTTQVPTSPSTSPPRTASSTPGGLLSQQPMTAADGTKLSACSDGECQIRVSRGKQIRFESTLGHTVVRITAVSEQSGFGLNIRRADGSVSNLTTGPTQREIAVFGNVRLIAVAVRRTSGILQLRLDG